MRFHLSMESTNEKTGPIPVSTSSAETCPDTCGFKDGNGCYAENFPLSVHWNKVTDGKRGVSWSDFLDLVRTIPLGQLWRHNQAGDLPGKGGKIDGAMLRQLVAASQGTRGFTYTHKHVGGMNLELIAFANQNGFTINLSADSFNEADRLAALNVGPVVVVTPRWHHGIYTTAEDRRIVTCPATAKDSKTTCNTCGICQSASRDVIVGFRAHGAKADRVTRNILPKLF